jgi:hypothetical protein
MNAHDAGQALLMPDNQHRQLDPCWIGRAGTGQVSSVMPGARLLTSLISQAPTAGVQHDGIASSPSFTRVISSIRSHNL